MENTQKVENKVWKIAKTVLNVIFYLFITFLILFSISNFGVKDNLDIPGIFGSGFLTVESDSMAGEEKDSFTKNDLIFVKLAPKINTEFVKNIKVGDIITFEYATPSSGIVLNTHRVVEIRENANGTRTFITQGDYVAMNDAYKYVPGSEENDPSKYEVVEQAFVVAKYTGKLSGAGKTMKYVRSSTGFLVCVVIPTAIFLIFELVILVINITKFKQSKLNEKTKEDREKELEEAKAKIRAELLAEMEANKDKKEEIKEENK